MLIGLRFWRKRRTPTQANSWSGDRQVKGPPEDLRNGFTQAHTVFTCHTAARPFVQTPSPGRNTGMLTVVTCDQMHGAFGDRTHHAHSTRPSQKPSWVIGCHALYALSGVSPAFAPQQQPTLLMLADKHTRNACLFSDPSNHAARGVPTQDALERTSLWLVMMKVFLSRNGHQDPKQADRNHSGQLAQSLPVSICPPSLLGHHPMVTSLLDRSKVISPLMKDGNGKRTFELGPIVTMSCHQWDSNAKNKTHLIPPDKTHLFHVCLVSKRRSNPLQARVAPDGWRTYPVHNEPPIPGPSPSSEPPEDILTREPEPEVAPTQSMEEHFCKSSFLFLYSYQLFLTPPSTISSSSLYSMLH
ncbi:hypothetical protein O181_042181, partial [Austropuccinia psidii MF-1]|nr:hypothetical protein [Austropuccinia psidii MF-1]